MHDLADVFFRFEMALELAARQLEIMGLEMALLGPLEPDGRERKVRD